MKLSQQMAAASVSFTPFISVVTALSVDGDPCAQINCSLPVYEYFAKFVSFIRLARPVRMFDPAKERCAIWNIKIRIGEVREQLTGITFLLFPRVPCLGST
jgi:hypothetical protein